MPVRHRSPWWAECTRILTNRIKSGQILVGTRTGSRTFHHITLRWHQGSLKNSTTPYPTRCKRCSFACFCLLAQEVYFYCCMCAPKRVPDLELCTQDLMEKGPTGLTSPTCVLCAMMVCPCTCGLTCCYFRHLRQDYLARLAAIILRVGARLEVSLVLCVHVTVSTHIRVALSADVPMCEAICACDSD